MDVIEVRGLAKRFGRVQALRDVTFAVPRGRVAGLLGPNGSGKTTTLKILVGLLRRDWGEVRVFGMDPWLLGPEVREKMGVLHEKPLYPRGARVSTLLRYAARLRGYSYSDALRVARLVGIEGLLGYTVSALSRGYLQRLGIALALLGDPELLVLDEPTANLDPLARAELLRLIKVLHRDLGVTVLVSSHIIPELADVCDYAVFISGGVTLDWGSLEELNRKYGVVSVYEVSTPRPRELARELISLDYVYGVDVHGGLLRVRVAGEASPELLNVLAEMGVDIESVRHVGGELGQLYSKVVTQEAAG